MGCVAFGVDADKSGGGGGTNHTHRLSTAAGFFSAGVGREDGLPCTDVTAAAAKAHATGFRFVWI